MGLIFIQIPIMIAAIAVMHFISLFCSSFVIKENGKEHVREIRIEENIYASP